MGADEAFNTVAEYIRNSVANAVDVNPDNISVIFEGSNTFLGTVKAELVVDEVTSEELEKLQSIDNTIDIPQSQVRIQYTGLSMDSINEAVFEVEKVM